MTQITIDIAAEMMGIPMSWVQSCINNGSLTSNTNNMGETTIDAHQIRSKGWNAGEQSPAPSYGDVNRMLGLVGARVFH